MWTCNERLSCIRAIKSFFISWLPETSFCHLNVLVMGRRGEYVWNFLVFLKEKQTKILLCSTLFWIALKHSIVQYVQSEAGPLSQSMHNFLYLSSEGVLFSSVCLLSYVPMLYCVEGCRTHYRCSYSLSLKTRIIG